MNVESITSLDAYQKLISNDNYLLIDIRTPGEWKEFGVPKIDGKIEFISWPWGVDAASLQIFVSDLQKIIEQSKANANIAKLPRSSEQELFFICKAGGRSAIAAEVIANLGYSYIKCYNIIDGFSGSLDGKGWKNNDLPWQKI